MIKGKVKNKCKQAGWKCNLYIVLNIVFYVYNIMQFISAAAVCQLKIERRKKYINIDNLYSTVLFSNKNIVNVFLNGNKKTQ